MKVRLKTHLTHYLALAGILAAIIFGFVQFPYDKSFQVALVIAAGLSFVVWGIVHHWLHEDLHLKVILEYITTALLGAIILLALIWR